VRNKCNELFNMGGRMNILSFISGIFTPAAKLIDDLHVSDEERLKLRNEMMKIKSAMHDKSIQLMSVEAKSDHFIVAAWRPMTMLGLLSLILLDGFGFINAPEQVYSLFEVFGTAYVGGRSLEKLTKNLRK
jgi:hypothetical protein